MARCPYLEYKSGGFFSSSNDKYECKLCGQEMYTDDPKVKHTCNPDSGYEYEKCPVYKDRR